MIERTVLSSSLSRALDVIIASVAIVLTAPLMLAAAAAVRLTSSGPVIFRQERVGRHGERFTLHKFRTMRAGAPEDKHREFVSALISDRDRAVDGAGDVAYKLSDDERVTAVGRWLRRYSIDELPQFFDVLAGSMAVVGPRPGLPYEAALYGELERRRLLVRPGITGLWQVSGRNHLSMHEMFELDARYVDERDVRLDLKIIARTPLELIHPSGAR
jgi:lipopolysaccharide/colanic/teichoic acid biosynthesis glycosyltransferase